MPQIAKTKLTQVIAERELQLAARGRRREKVHVRFGKPRPLPHGRDYGCVYQIEGLHEEPITRHIFGVDSIQALELAMQMAMVELVCSTAYGAGRLTWLGMYDLGLPVAKAIRGRIKKEARSHQRGRQRPGRGPSSKRP